MAAKVGGEPVLTFERPFAHGRLALCVSSQAWRFPFVDFAQALVDAHGGEVVERVGPLGTDEVYWDLRLDGDLRTLHSQHFLGVYLCATTEQSEERLRQLEPFVARYLADSTSASSWLPRQWRRVRAVVSMLSARRPTERS
jgi:hypothetical protein